MASRHLSRSIVVQSLFEWDFNNLPDDKIKDIVERNINEFAPGIENKSFAKNLASDILKNHKKIDQIIGEAAPEWPLNQVAIVDRNILRLGLYELLFGKRDEVPAKVAINEAIELAKSLGGSSSSKFVNGVLGTVYKEIGEPGKGDVATKKGKVDPAKLPKESLGGAVVYAKHNGAIYVAFVHNVFGFWTLPKGRIDLNTKESVEECTTREVKEETGLDIKIESVLDVNEYVAKTTERGTLLKKVSYFLASSKFQDLELENPDDKTFKSLDDVKWFKLEEIPDLKIYDDIRPIITKAMKILISKQK